MNFVLKSLENLDPNERFGTLEMLEGILLNDPSARQHMPFFLGTGDICDHDDHPHAPPRFFLPIPMSSDDIDDFRERLIQKVKRGQDDIIMGCSISEFLREKRSDAIIKGIIIYEVARTLAKEIPHVFRNFELIMDAKTTLLDKKTHKTQWEFDALISIAFSLDNPDVASINTVFYSGDGSNIKLLSTKVMNDVDRAKELDEFMIDGAIKGYKSAILDKLTKQS